MTREYVSLPRYFTKAGSPVLRDAAAKALRRVRVRCDPFKAPRLDNWTWGCFAMRKEARLAWREALRVIRDEIDRPGGTTSNIRWDRVPDIRAILKAASL